jgi:hypothetical protein
MRPRLLVLALLLALGGGAQAATVLIRDATVHTVTAAGVQQHTDILIRDGYVAELGQAPGAGGAHRGGQYARPVRWRRTSQDQGSGLSPRG